MYQAFEDSTTYCSFKRWPFRVFAFDKILDYERLIVTGSHVPGSDGARVRSILKLQVRVGSGRFHVRSIDNITRNCVYEHVKGLTGITQYETLPVLNLQTGLICNLSVFLNCLRLAPQPACTCRHCSSSSLASHTHIAIVYPLYAFTDIQSNGTLRPHTMVTRRRDEINTGISSGSWGPTGFTSTSCSLTGCASAADSASQGSKLAATSSCSTCDLPPYVGCE